MSDVLRRTVAQNRSGMVVSIPSVCSAHSGVLEASLRLAERLDRPIVIEATSNQVNQFGGYTGMRPAAFVQHVRDAAQAAGADIDRVVLGGDHLGTQAWKAHASDVALAHARQMVGEYVDAGFDKIHLDCSEGCAGEPLQLSDAVTAERSALLAEACLEAGGGRPLSFVVGTEVPPPGGARSDETDDLPATTPDRASATLEAHCDAFEARGIGAAVPMIVALVVQPGVEFSPTHVHHLPMERDPRIIQALDEWPNTCLEAHSTDFQRDEAFPRLAALGFAFQKVGPAATFAWREAVYRLDALRVLAGWGQPIVLPAMEELMLAEPEHWTGHYRGDEETLQLQRHFGLADRIRYYWPREKARIAVEMLFEDLRSRQLLPTVLRQVFPCDIIERAERIDLPRSEALVAAGVEAALAPYYF